MCVYVVCARERRVVDVIFVAREKCGEHDDDDADDAGVYMEIVATVVAQLLRVCVFAHENRVCMCAVCRYTDKYEIIQPEARRR